MKNNTNTNNYSIGFISVAIGPIFGTPLKVIKVSVQTSNNTNVKNSFEYVIMNYKRNGILGFYPGFLATALKDAVFGASFVGNYYTFRDYLGVDKWYKNFFSEAAPHCITWYIFIPIDYIKTTVQKSEQKITTINVIRNGYNNGGIKIFWKGVVPDCLRTIPVSGVAMIGYEKVRQLLN